jgi:hypothetical protein
MSEPDAQLIDRAVDCVSRLIGGSVAGAQMIRAGGNNRIIRVDRRGEAPCAVKIYFRHPADKRDRLATEFGALSFLWRHGVYRTPQPLAADYDRGMAVYTFVKGARIDPSSIERNEIAAAAEMLALLRDLTGAPDSRTIGPASEASFTLDDLLSNLHERHQRHAGVGGAEPIYDEYAIFRDGPLRQALQAVEEAARADMLHAGESPHQELSHAARTLSPSDFGFHNAIRTPTGELVFLDFEYFGWDDPAKTVCDFCYHPGMTLRPDMQRLFVGSVVPLLGGNELERRIRRLSPLFGLKWCLILLNEFLPEGRLRRNLATSGSDRLQDLLSVQLAKAHAMLHQVIRESERHGILGLAS